MCVKCETRPGESGKVRMCQRSEARPEGWGNAHVRQVRDRPGRKWGSAFVPEVPGPPGGGGEARQGSQCRQARPVIDPFEIQVSAGCVILAGNSSESAFHVAFQGREILSFQGMWVPAPDAPQWVGAASKVLSQDRGTSATIQWLLNDTCPRLVRGLLAAGKADLETQDTPFPAGRSEARGLAVRGFQSRARPFAAGVPRLRIPPKTGVGDVDAGRAGAAGHPARGRSAQCRRDLAPPSNAGCGSRKGGGPVLPSEAQQPRRPGCHPLLGRGEPCLRGLDRRGSAVSPCDPWKRHLVQEALLLSGHPVTVLTTRVCLGHRTSRVQDIHGAQGLRVSGEHPEEAGDHRKPAVVTSF
ncbi:uncharacterized protein [Manis javanica]|uniref:uncharacterized protein isoform X3 n=1 Tax=Manis javanica TaxID=9974 RepID=UPI003C6D73E7